MAAAILTRKSSYGTCVCLTLMPGLAASNFLMSSSIACTRCAKVYCQYSISTCARAGPVHASVASTAPSQNAALAALLAMDSPFFASAGPGVPNGGDGSGYRAPCRVRLTIAACARSSTYPDDATRASLGGRRMIPYPPLELHVPEPPS